MIRVLIVEDSPVVQNFLVHILSSDQEINIVGIANDGEEALEAAKRYKPDIITMDIYMPKMDGFEATKKIMETRPTPIVIVSGNSRVTEVAFSFRAIEAGALAVVSRPKGIDDKDFEKSAKELIRTLKLMSEIKVVRRWPGFNKKISAASEREVKVGQSIEKIKVVAMGASTGGPVALQNILTNLPRNFPVPILIVQHIIPGFILGFARWLADSSLFPVHVANDSEYALPGHAYVAPDGSQMLMDRDNKIRLNKEISENGLRPSVSYLFRSIAQTFGSGAIGVLLTGMGSDGAKELRLMKEKHAVTIAQDEESSMIHGMPGEAIKLNAATYVLPLSKIAGALINLTKDTDRGKN